MDSIAVRFIHVSDELSYNTIADARVDYQPNKKYRVEKKNAFDPTYIHRREPYYEDSIAIAAILTPTLYSALDAMFRTPGLLFVEFAHQGGYVKQFQVEVTGFPTLNDDLREYTSETKISLVARYSTPPAVIDWDTYSIPDGMENIV
jgi:hypothetical protein